MGRWQLMQAILLFAGTPLYLLFLLATATAAATDTTSPFPARWALALILGWLGALYAPKLLGYAEIALSPEKRDLYGGLPRLACGACAEFTFTLLLDAISSVAKSIALLHLALGIPTHWNPQNRSDRGVDWREATRFLWPQTVIGLAVFVAFAHAGATATLWALPLAGGLLLAIPLCVWTADPRVGQWMRSKAITAIPEELADYPGHAPAPALAFQPQADGN